MITVSVGPAIWSMATVPTTDALGQGDKDVAGAQDLVDPGHALGAIGQGGDGLGAAHAEDAAHAGDVAGAEDHRAARPGGPAASPR